MLDHIHWLGHDGFLIDWNGKAILIDPFELSAGFDRKADVIFVTHTHYDHLSEPDIEKVSHEQTTIICTRDALPKLIEYTAEAVRPGQSGSIAGIHYEAVPAYNVDKKFHPRSADWVGYILTIGNVRIYHAGDTDYIPEMKDVSADIALLPVSGTYVMTAEEAIKAALTIQPDVAIPMHYGAIVGSRDDAVTFVNGLSGKIRTVVKEKLE